MEKIKHPMNTITNSKDRNQLDNKIKSAKSIDKNNSIMQELYFAKPETKVQVNKIYTGSQLWDLSSREVEKLESTYNRSVKIMYYMEPLTGDLHVRRLRDIYYPVSEKHFFRH